LVGADLRDCNLDKAELDSAKLDRANLTGANLTRANLEGASAEEATFDGARLTNAELDSVSFAKADLSNANLGHADLNDAYLGGAQLARCDARGANFSGANLERASLIEGVFDGADMTGALADGIDLTGASLLQVNLTGALLKNAKLSRADLRRAVFTDANLVGADLSQAKAWGAIWQGAVLQGLRVDSLDVGQGADGQRMLSGVDATTFLTGAAPEPAVATRRYFGRGDVLRNATLEFNAGSIVVIESRFENCSITLGDATELTIGQPGLLVGCRVRGPGVIVVQGGIYETDHPAVAGAAKIIVREGGVLSGTVEQHAQKTIFGLERGCRLRVSITHAP
jgi:uncharacterized protein YjbI with pentapeptide repeats